LDGSAGTTAVTDTRSLRSLQSLLVKSLGYLIRYAYERGYELTLGEAYVQTPRKARDGTFVQDGVHMPSSLHYTRLAIDLNLFIRGVYITRSDDMAWIDLGSFWKALDPACTWGGDFPNADANHFSVTFGNRK
jgi:hypothetical protein